MDKDFFLIQAIKSGDEKKTDYFIRKYYSQIYRYCLFRVKDKFISEDLTQETFLYFFKYLNRYKNYDKALNFLYVIARNKCIDHYRKRKEIYIEDVSKEIFDYNIYDEDDAILKMDIENAIEKLSEDIKETAILYFFQGLKQKEIATILNINVSLVKYRVFRAKTILSKYL